MNALQLGHSAAALARILSFSKPADAALGQYFGQHRQLGQQDRRLIAETVFSCIRHYQKISTLLPRPQQEPRLAALAADYFARGRLCEAATGDEARQLQTLLRRPLPDTLPLNAELPQWLADMLAGQMTAEEITALGRSTATPAPLDLRVNTLKGRRDSVLAQLRQEFPDAQATPFSPHGIRLPGKPALNKHPLYTGGTIEIQDEGSQLIALILGARRGEIIVDFCAGAGGKSLALAAQMAGQGRIYAFDVTDKRLADIKERTRRAGTDIILPQRIGSGADPRTAKLAGKADRVLVDAPCSGLGTLRRNPDLKYRQSPASVGGLCQLQQDILDKASALVKPGGRLVYATCSILRQENSGQIEHFLQRHPEFELLDCASLLAAQKIPLQTGTFLQLSTAEHQTDGFFAAAMQRKAA